MRGAPWQGGTVIVTGASAGLGEEFARQLAPNVGRLLLVARRVDRLEALKKELEATSPSTQVSCYSADLQRKSEVLRLALSLQQEKVAVDLLVNNAGLGDLGLFETAPLDRVEQMLRVNVEALTILTHELLPEMIQRKKGVIINVGSVAGYLPLPTFAVYAATKAYVNSFSEALHWELKKTGVSVTAVCPGPIRTEFFKVAERANGKRSVIPPEFLSLSATQAVHQSLKAAAQRRPRVVTGFWVSLGAAFIGKLPFWWLRLYFRMVTARK